MNTIRKPGRLLFPLFLLGLIVFLSGPPAKAQTTSGAYYLPLAYIHEPSRWLGPDGGSVVCLAFDPTNRLIAYAGTSGSGVYKTADGGANWFKANRGIDALSLDSLVIDPKNPLVVYAGTHGQGVYKTTDGGGTWKPVTQGLHADSIVYALAVNSGNDNLVYAGTRIQNTLDGVLYKTTNGGESWFPVFSQSEDWVYSLAVNPNHPDSILAATHAHGPYIAYHYGGAGEWSPAVISDGEWGKGRAVAYDPRSWTSGAYFGAWHGDFYRSSNDGASWQISDTGLGFAHVYPNGIVVKPDDPNTLYLASHNSGGSTPDGGIYRSTNSGASWSLTGLSGRTIYTVASPGGSTLLAGTYLDGLYKSSDGGSSWYHSMAGLANTQVTGMAFSGPSTVYASTEGGGISKSTDGGFTWQCFNSNLNNLYVNGLVQHPANPNILFALTSTQGLRRYDLSTNAGWTAAENLPLSTTALQTVTNQGNPFIRREPLDDYLELEGLPPAQTALDVSGTAVTSAGINAMVFDPSNPNTAYLATNGDGLYKSLNSAASSATWTRVGLAGTVVWRVSVSPQNGSLLYAATNKNGVVKKSTDGGATWTDLPLPDASLVVTTVMILPGDTGSVYAGTSSGIWRYNGASWEATGLQGYYITVLAFNPFNPNVQYAGTTYGAFYSLDHRQWYGAASELKSLTIQSISFNPAYRSYIYFGTSAQGTLRISSTQ